jgi:hypothetical protein
MNIPNLTSSLRKQGPITTGFNGYKRHLPPGLNERTRRMGPCFRRDDARSAGCARHTQLSSPGLTGRSSTPGLLGSILDVSGILDPRFRGDDDGARGDGSCFVQQLRVGR